MKNRWVQVVGWLALGGFLLLAVGGFYDGFLGMIEKVTLASRRYWVFLAICALLGAAWLAGLAILLRGRGLPRALTALLQALDRVPGWLRWALAVVLVILPTVLLLFSSFGNMSFGYWFRLALIAVGAYLAVLVTSPRVFSPREALLRFAAAVCLAGATFAAGGWLNNISNYPFSMYWSEGNRFWDFSVLFGSGRYQISGNEPIFTFIAVGRQFLWAIPFLFPGLTIAGMRAWDALLWVWPPLLLGWLAASGLPRNRLGWIGRAIFAVWAFVFLAQGPIYAPLVVCAMVVAIAMRRKSLVLAALLVMLAGYYAYISRWTWLYAPGLWAGMLALLDVPQPTLRREGWKGLIRPLTLGLAGYFGGQILPKMVDWAAAGFKSPVQLEVVLNATAKVARQPLVWDRLLPNPTYRPGILLGLLWAGLPVLVLLFWAYRRRLWRMNALQIFGVLFPSLAFLVVGVIASTKIGGGSNLHNLDMFWIALVFLTAWMLQDAFRQDPAGGFAQQPVFVVLLAVTLMMPAAYAAQYGAPLVLPQRRLVDESVEKIQAAALDALPRGEVLFMDQRQLLTFGDVRGVPLVVDYEKKYVMDQAMEGDPQYFDNFYQDLARKRFSLIVTEPIQSGYVNADTRNFAEENNAWVKWVSKPLLKYYRPLLTLDEVGVQLLVPVQ